MIEMTITALERQPNGRVIVWRGGEGFDFGSYEDIQNFVKQLDNELVALRLILADCIARSPQLTDTSRLLAKWTINPSAGNILVRG